MNKATAPAASSARIAERNALAAQANTAPAIKRGSWFAGTANRSGTTGAQAPTVAHRARTANGYVVTAR